MKSLAGDQPGGLRYHRFENGHECLAQKWLSESEQIVVGRGCSRFPAVPCLALRSSLLSFAARVLALLGFHLLNAVLGICGSALVVTLLLSNIAMLLVSISVAVLYCLVELVRLMCPKRTWLAYAAILLGVLIATQLLFGWDALLLMAVVYIPMTPAALMVVVAVVMIIFFTFAALVKGLARLDVGLANFVVPAIPRRPCTDPQPKKTALRVVSISYKDPCDGKASGWEQLVPLVCLTPGVWAVIFYFILLKLCVGILSGISVLLSVVQPVLVFASSGDFPCAGSGETYQDNAGAYVTKMLLLWVLGVFAVMYAPALSVQWTLRGCAEYEPEQQQQGVEEQQSGQEAFRRGDSEDTAASFVDLEDAGSGISLPSQKTTA